MKTKTTIRVISECPFCGSRRVSLYECHDDHGGSVAVRCMACEAQGPVSRCGVGQANNISHEMKREAAQAWNMIWGNFTGAPKPIRIELIGDKEFWYRDAAPARPPRRRPAKAKPTAVRAPALEAPAYSPALAEEHRAFVIPAPTSLNGHGLNGQNGAVR